MTTQCRENGLVDGPTISTAAKPRFAEVVGPYRRFIDATPKNDLELIRRRVAERERAAAGG